VKFAGDIPTAVKEAKDLKVRGSDFENHAAGIGEGIPAGQWVAIEMMPHSIVEACRDGAEFWLNKVRMAHRGK
jgi:hypothetical protein